MKKCTYLNHRNYLFLYQDQYELNEVDVLHIKNVHKVDKNIDAMVRT